MLNGSGSLESLFSRPNSGKGRLQRAAHAILLEHNAAGAIPTSNRFVFYEAEQRGIVSKTRTGKRRADQDFTDAVMALRERGIIPWDWIVDETREVIEWHYAATVADYARHAIQGARIDCWDGQSPPLILSESRSLALRRIAEHYLCPIASTNGQVGGFLVTEIALCSKTDAESCTWATTTGKDIRSGRPRSGGWRADSNPSTSGSALPSRKNRSRGTTSLKRGPPLQTASHPQRHRDRGAVTDHHRAHPSGPPGRTSPRAARRRSSEREERQRRDLLNP
jgi:hypothetical protein